MIEWNFGLDDLMKKRHFWKTVFLTTLLIMVTFFFDMLGPMSRFSGSIYAFSIMGIIAYGLGMFHKRGRSKRAKRVNNMGLTQEELKTLERFDDMKEDLGTARDLKNSGVEKLKEGKDINWRDVY